MKKTLLECVEQITGPILAFDGLFVVWGKAEHPVMQRNVFDLRDILPRVVKDSKAFKNTTLADLRASIPMAEKPKRVKVTPTEEE